MLSRAQVCKCTSKAELLSFLPAHAAYANGEDSLGLGNRMVDADAFSGVVAEDLLSFVSSLCAEHLPSTSVSL
eukprot:1190549-Amphidinium_carterae.2